MPALSDRSFNPKSLGPSGPDGVGLLAPSASYGLRRPITATRSRRISKRFADPQAAGPSTTGLRGARRATLLRDLQSDKADERSALELLSTIDDPGVIPALELR
jgi:hypothetical protein